MPKWGSVEIRERESCELVAGRVNNRISNTSFVFFNIRARKNSNNYCLVTILTSGFSCRSWKSYNISTGLQCSSVYTHILKLFKAMSSVPSYWNHVTCINLNVTKLRKKTINTVVTLTVHYCLPCCFIDLLCCVYKHWWPSCSVIQAADLSFISNFGVYCVKVKVETLLFEGR